jgi:hypothetical protein
VTTVHAYVLSSDNVDPFACAVIIVLAVYILEFFVWYRETITSGSTGFILWNGENAYKSTYNLKFSYRLMMLLLKI